MSNGERIRIDRALKTGSRLRFASNIRRNTEGVSPLVSRDSENKSEFHWSVLRGNLQSICFKIDVPQGSVPGPTLFKLTINDLYVCDNENIVSEMLNHHF